MTGARVFLSASVPNASQPDFMAGGVQARAIDEAVTSLTAALLSRGIGMVFGGHPSISPLVALVALQRQGWRREGAPPIVIYQSRAFEGLLPDESWALFRSGVARIEWTDAEPGEARPFPLSLAHMRERMLRETAPTAMVCIGGMKGVLDEADAFTRICGPGGARIHLLGSTGGATGLLASRRHRLVGAAPVVWDADHLDRRAVDTGEADPVPYPFLVQKLVDGIAP